MSAPMIAGVGAATVTLGSNLLETHDVGLATVAIVGSVVYGGVWWLSRHLQKISDQLEHGKERFERLESRIDKIEDKINSHPQKK